MIAKDGRVVEAVFGSFAGGPVGGGAADDLTDRAQPRIEHRSHGLQCYRVGLAHIAGTHQSDADCRHHPSGAGCKRLQPLSRNRVA